MSLSVFSLLPSYPLPPSSARKICKVVVSVGLLFYVLGISALGGVIFMVLSVPVGKWTSKRTQAFQKILMKRKDDRMSVIGETMQVC